MSEGFKFWKVHGESSPFPPDYECSVHTNKFIETVWARHMNLRDIFSGSSPRNFLGATRQLDDLLSEAVDLGQDVVVMQKK